MKSLLFILAASLSFTSIAPAEVFIYKNKIKYSITGGGGTTRLSATGWTIINEFGDVVQILAYSSKRYAIVPLESIEYSTADAGGGKEYSFFVQHDAWTDGDGHLHVDTGGAKGLNSIITVNGTPWSLPKTWTWGGRSMYPANSSGTMRYEESTGTFAFDKKWTDTSNASADDINAAANRLAQSLEAQGYQSF